MTHAVELLTHVGSNENALYPAPTCWAPFSEWFLEWQNLLSPLLVVFRNLEEDRHVTEENHQIAVANLARRRAVRTILLENIDDLGRLGPCGLGTVSDFDLFT